MSDGPIAIIAGHASFAEGMRSAIARIMGLGDRFIALSNDTMGTAEIEERLHELVNAHPIRAIFTDLPAGSCTIAARRLLKTRTDIVLVTGVSLPLLLDFIADEERPAAEAVTRAIDRAARAFGPGPGAARGH